MNLEQKINEEIKSAMKAGQKLRLETLRSVRAAIIEFAKSGLAREMNEDDEIKILNNLAKKRKDAIEMYKQANRNELMEKEQEELGIIAEFLPKQLTEDEIKAILVELVKSVGAESPKDMGKVMGPVMKQLSGKADGNQVKTILQEILGNN